MNRQTTLVVAVFLVGTCISAKAADPAPKNPPTVILTAVEATKPSATTTPYQFPGKLVRVQMTGGTRNEFFVLENATLTPLNPMNGSEWFLVGTGIKNGPRQTSWCEGLEVHLNLHLVASYCPLTPEQWKEQQRSTPRIGPGQSVPSQPAAGPSAAQTIAPPAGIAPNIEAQLKTAQDERVKVLTQLVEALASQGKLGIVNADQVFSAETDLCNALLDSTDEPEKRVALLTKQLDKANAFLESIQGQVKAGIVGQADGLRAKSLYLNANIKLLREGSSKRPLTSTPTAKRP